jgi:methylase of polypeptide subunit release factors
MERGGSFFRTLYRKVLWQWIRFSVRDGYRLRVERVAGIEIIVLPGVFNGVLLRTGQFLVEALERAALAEDAGVLDLGTGSGIGAIFAARRAAHVVATDLNPEAARCAQINALAQHLDHRIETRVGDLFAPVGNDRFDLILFNPPYFRGKPRDLPDAAWRSPDVFDRFLDELPEHLSEDGRALVVLSTDGEIGAALRSAKHLSACPVLQRDLVNEVLTVYEIRVIR